MNEKYLEIAAATLNVPTEGVWKYLEDGIENMLIPDHGDARRLTTSFDPNGLLYWLSGTWKSVEPKHHPERRIEHLLMSNPDMVDYLSRYYESRVNDIYPLLDYDKYRNEIEVALSHTILDYEILNTLTDANVILDYSAGYGRMLCLFNRNERWKYVAAESIPATMVVFSVFNYGFFLSRLYEPITTNDLSNFTLPLYTTTSGLSNLDPESIDCLAIIWAYSEYDSKGAGIAITNINRLVRPGGYVYIRDISKPITHSIDIDYWLTTKLQLPFKLEYRLNDPRRSFGEVRLYKRDIILKG